MRDGALSPSPPSPVARRDDEADSSASAYSAHRRDHSRCYAPLRFSMRSEFVRTDRGPASLGPDSVWDADDGSFDVGTPTTARLEIRAARRTAPSSPSSIISLDWPCRGRHGEHRGGAFDPLSAETTVAPREVKRASESVHQPVAKRGPWRDSQRSLCEDLH